MRDFQQLSSVNDKRFGFHTHNKKLREIKRANLAVLSEGGGGEKRQIFPKI